MSVSLRELTPQNFRPTARLKVAPDQEGFVAPVTFSIAESKVEPYLLNRVIYHEEEPVGHILFGRDPDDGRVWLVRLMVASQFQRKGYGGAAVNLLVEEIKTLLPTDALFLSFVPANTGAEKLYERLGFVKTGEISHGEEVMRLPIT